VVSDSDSKPERGIWIIDVEPSATVATTKLQHGEPDEPEEPHVSRGCQVVGPADNVAPTILHHSMDPPRKQSLRQPTVSTIVRHQALQI
jgi:hypothetical protein